MSALTGFCLNLCCALCLGFMGCADAPGHPAPGPEVRRPDQVLDFATLYKQNCAGCHGANGKNGAAISLSNPVYLAFAGEATVRKITANGVGGKLMPGFARSSGGALTDPQIDSLVHGIFQAWGDPDVLAGLPPYTSGEEADANRAENGGQKIFAGFCGRCHAPGAGSIVDPAYLALASDQSLRSAIVAGRPDLGMPDWRSDISGAGARAMTDQEITDIVAWLAAQRVAYPGQPYMSRK
jgi:mono/diheme cytochrome c family protein